MKPEIQIADFLKYNAPALNEMKNESPEIAAAFAQVIKELAQKYGNIGPIGTSQSSKTSFSKEEYMSLTGNVYYFTTGTYFVKQVKFKEGFLPSEYSVILTLKEFTRGKKAGKEQDVLLTNHYEVFFALSQLKLYDTLQDEQNKTDNYRVLLKKVSFHTALKQYFYINLEAQLRNTKITLHYEGKTVTDDLCLFRFAQIVDGVVIPEKQYMSAEQCAEMLLNNDFKINSPSKGIDLSVRPLNYWLSILLKFNYVEFNSKTDIIGLEYQRYESGGKIIEVVKNSPKNKIVKIGFSQGETQDVQLSSDEIDVGIQKVSSTNATTIRPPGQNNQFIAKRARFLTRHEMESRFLTINNAFRILRGQAETTSLLTQISQLGINIQDVLDVIQNKTFDELGEEGILFADFGGAAKAATGDLLVQGHHFILNIREQNIRLKNSLCVALTTIEDPIPYELLNLYEIQYELDETYLHPEGGFARRTLQDNMLFSAQSDRSILCEANIIKSINLQEKTINYEFQPKGENMPFENSNITFDSYMEFFLYFDYNTFYPKQKPFFSVKEKYPILISDNTTKLCEITFRSFSTDWDYSFVSDAGTKREGMSNHYLQKSYNPQYISVGDKIKITEAFMENHPSEYLKMKNEGIDFYTITNIKITSWAGVRIQIQTTPNNQSDLVKDDGLYLKDLERY